ncbi:MAG: ADP-ribosylglycohydrolase family protein [Kofleriaceae bacterium]|nr:ADP-ribosylglycohydrolase family protein [Kofleriaceae bacterium]
MISKGNKAGLQRALNSLVGLSVGDALGERYFGPPDSVLRRIEGRELPAKSGWRYTDDTEMALSVYAMLRELGEIDQDSLAQLFAVNMQDGRGYGPGAFKILWAIQRGEAWPHLSYGAFGGTGSYGNGAAMRVAPLGAYFADDLERCVQQARLQAEVTHTHQEGIDGSIAIAVATALVWRDEESLHSASGFLSALIDLLPAGKIRDEIVRASEIPEDVSAMAAASVLGNGSKISAADTVPICVWIVSRRRGDYREAFWETVALLGDRDTTCAIVGGILSVRAEVPTEWVAAREPFPDWLTA